MQWVIKMIQNKDKAVLEVPERRDMGGDVEQETETGAQREVTARYRTCG